GVCVCVCVCVSSHQVEDEGELWRAAGLQRKGRLTGQLLLGQRRHVLDEEIPGHRGRTCECVHRDGEGVCGCVCVYTHGSNTSQSSSYVPSGGGEGGAVG